MITDTRTNRNNCLQQNVRANSPRADNYILEKKAHTPANTTAKEYTQQKTSNVTDLTNLH